MYGQRQPQWPIPGWLPPQRRTVPQRIGHAAAAGAARAARAGWDAAMTKAAARRRALYPGLLALLAHVVGGVLWLLRRFGAHHYAVTAAGARVSVDYAVTVDVAVVLVVAVAALKYRVARWPTWRRVYLLLATAMVLVYLPVASWRTPGPPVLWVSLPAGLGMWVWLYRGYYRIREIPEVEPTEVYGPAEVWAEEIGGTGKMLPGSVLTAVRDIEAPA